LKSFFAVSAGFSAFLHAFKLNIIIISGIKIFCNIFMALKIYLVVRCKNIKKRRNLLNFKKYW